MPQEQGGGRHWWCWEEKAGNLVSSLQTSPTGWKRSRSDLMMDTICVLSNVVVYFGCLIKKLCNKNVHMWRRERKSWLMKLGRRRHWCCLGQFALRKAGHRYPCQCICVSFSSFFKKLIIGCAIMHVFLSCLHVQSYLGQYAHRRHGHMYPHRKTQRSLHDFNFTPIAP